MAVPTLEILVRASPGEFTLHSFDARTALLRSRPQAKAADVTASPDGWVVGAGRRLLRLTPEELWLWDRMDGARTVQDLATAWFLEFGAIDLEHIARLLQRLRAAGLLGERPAGLVRRRPAVTWEWRWTGVDAPCRALWRGVRWLVNSWTAPLWLATLLVGSDAWLHLPPAATGGPARWLALGGALLLHLIPHELGHALAVTAFGRSVRAVGVGVRGAWVDTSEMLLGSRWQLAAVSLAGPATSLVLAAGAALVAARVPTPLAGTLANLADGGFLLAGLTLWPFALDSDGYRALCAGLGGDPRRAALAGLNRRRLRPAHLAWLTLEAVAAAGLATALLAGR
jgi:hypothetical protein